MSDTDAKSPVCAGDVFAGLVGRLRLTQGELRALLGPPEGSSFILPDLGASSRRLASVAAALTDALALVDDDRLVARWLRAPLARRGGATPLQEIERVEGDGLIRFVLCPHPTELVGLIARPRKAGRPPVGEGQGRWHDADA